MRKTAAATPAPSRLDYRFTGYHKFLDPDGYPAIAPPWGTLNAIDLNTGEYAWKIPLRRISGAGRQGPEGHRQRELRRPRRHRRRAGLHRRHQSTTASSAPSTRAPASCSGKPSALAGIATPSTYEVNGRQFVVICASGGKSKTGGTAAVYVAFALPK